MEQTQSHNTNKQTQNLTYYVQLFHNWFHHFTSVYFTLTYSFALQLTAVLGGTEYWPALRNTKPGFLL